MYVLWSVTSMLLQGSSLDPVMVKVAEKQLRKVFLTAPQRVYPFHLRYHENMPSYDNLLLFCEVFDRQVRAMSRYSIDHHLTCFDRSRGNLLKHWN
jgi:hypothetical protein